MEPLPAFDVSTERLVTNPHYACPTTETRPVVSARDDDDAAIGPK